MKNNMEGNDVLQTVINTCNRYGIDWMQCPSYKELTQSDINRSRLRKDARFRTEVAEEIRLWANQWSLKETGEELFPKSFVSTTKQQAQYDNGWENMAGKLSESKLRKIVAESVKKVLNEEHGWDGMLSGGKILNGHIKNGNDLVGLKLMCEFLRKYVMPNGEEKDGKFIYQGHAVDVLEINRSIHEAICYLYDIVKQFGY